MGLATTEGQMCPVCATQQHTTRLQIYQINLEEALLMCPREKCTYPIGKDCGIFARGLSQIPVAEKRRPACNLPGSIAVAETTTSTCSPIFKTSVISEVPRPVCPILQTNSSNLAVKYNTVETNIQSTNEGLSDECGSDVINDLNTPDPLSSSPQTPTNTCTPDPSEDTDSNISSVSNDTQNAANAEAPLDLSFDIFEHVDLDMSLTEMDVPDLLENLEDDLLPAAGKAADTAALPAAGKKSAVSEDPSKLVNSDNRCMAGIECGPPVGENIPNGVNAMVTSTEGDQIEGRSSTRQDAGIADSVRTDTMGDDHQAQEGTLPAADDNDPMSLPDLGLSQGDTVVSVDLPSCDTQTSGASIAPQTVTEKSDMDYAESLTCHEPMLGDVISSNQCNNNAPASQNSHSEACATSKPATNESRRETIKSERDSTLISQNSELFAQWENKDSMCWLDVSLCILVHLQTLRKLRNQLPQFSNINMLLKAYDDACSLLRSCRLTDKEISLETSVGTVSVKTGGGEALVRALSNLAKQKTVIKFVNPIITKEKTIKIDPSNPSLIQELLAAVKLSNSLHKKDDGSCKGQSTGTKGGKDHASGQTVSQPPDDHQKSELNSSIGDDSDEEKLSQSKLLLDVAREKVWSAIEPRLHCKRGSNDSPVFALPLILDEHDALQRHFLVGYTWRMVCCHCGRQHTDKVERTLPTFPNVPGDFSMMAPCFIRSCFFCGAPQQRMNMVFDRLPPVMMTHFVEGLPDGTLSNYDFTYRGIPYHVAAAVQYKTNPNHFVAWIRNAKEDKWMECDDLSGHTCQFSQLPPGFHGSQVHILVWERDGAVPAEPPVCTKVEVMLTPERPGEAAAAKKVPLRQNSKHHPGKQVTAGISYPGGLCKNRASVAQKSHQSGSNSAMAGVRQMQRSGRAVPTVNTAGAHNRNLVAKSAAGLQPKSMGQTKNNRNTITSPRPAGATPSHRVSNGVAGKGDRKPDYVRLERIQQKLMIAKGPTAQSSGNRTASVIEARSSPSPGAAMRARKSASDSPAMTLRSEKKSSSAQTPVTKRQKLASVSPCEAPKPQPPSPVMSPAPSPKPAATVRPDPQKPESYLEQMRHVLNIQRGKSSLRQSIEKQRRFEGLSLKSRGASFLRSQSPSTALGRHSPGLSQGCHSPLLPTSISPNNLGTSNVSSRILQFLPPLHSSPSKGLSKKQVHFAPVTVTPKTKPVEEMPTLVKPHITTRATAMQSVHKGTTRDNEIKHKSSLSWDTDFYTICPPKKAKTDPPTSQEQTTTNLVESEPSLEDLANFF